MALYQNGCGTRVKKLSSSVLQLSNRFHQLPVILPWTNLRIRGLNNNKQRDPFLSHQAPLLLNLK